MDEVRQADDAGRVPRDSKLPQGRRRWRAGRQLAAVGGALAIAVATAACGSPSGNSSGSSQTLLLATTTPDQVSSFDPWSSGYGINNSLWIAQAVYDSLVHLNAEGQPIPSVATSWKVTGTSVTLNLRQGIKFTDGSPLNAAAVAANLNYGASHPSGNECDPYIQGVKTTVTSTTSVLLSLPHTIPGLMQDLGQCAGFIVNPKALGNKAMLSANAYGSGPYVVDTQATSIAQSKFVFTPNPNYWDKSAVKFSKIVWTGYNSRTAAVDAMRSGQADVLANQPPNDVQGIGVSVLDSSPQLLNGAWITDTTGALVKALGNVKVRQAMNYAIDRQALGKGLFGADYMESGSTPFAKYYLGYSSSLGSYYPYDPAKAKQLLAQAGYSKGITIPTLMSANSEQIAEAVAGYLSKVGINLQLSSHTSDYVTQMLSGNWPLVFGNYTLNPAELQTIQGIVGPSGFFNPRHNSSADVEALITKLQGASTTESQLPLYQQLATTIAGDGLLLVPFIVSAATAYNSGDVKVAAQTAGLPLPMLYDLTPAS
jgi:peptide/nickel transport system substrate-binding protein